MSTLKTVITFTYPSELMVVRSRLEFEGIECFVKDELTIQVDNFYSNAIGGLELQVREEDVDIASKVLEQMGHITSSPKIANNSQLLKLTNHIPILNKWPLSLRLLVLISVILVPLILFVQKQTERSLQSLLMSTNWCVNTIESNGVVESPNELPESAIYDVFQPCEVQINFDNDYHIYLPTSGLNQIKGHVMIRNDSIEIFGLDTLQNKYQHVYKVNITGQRLVLISPKTKMWCVKTAFRTWNLN